MRYLGLLFADPHNEESGPPSPEMLARMGSFVDDAMKQGVIVATEGLKPSRFGTRVKLDNGKRTVVDGPFTESKELVASYAILNYESREQAIEWTNRFLDVLGGGHVELRPLWEAADFAPPAP